MKYIKIFFNKIGSLFKKIHSFFNTHKKTKYITIFVIIIAILISTFNACKPFIDYLMRDKVTKGTLDRLNLDNYDNLMIVAHPDDDTLWGGAALIKDNYLVVCITNGKNDVRRNEFLNVMKQTNDIGLILDYPDKIFGQRSDWSFCKDAIYDDLNAIISYKNWNQIVTHNEKGEYGHIHHIMTHEIVADTCDSTNYTGNQYYFGAYYSLDKLSKLSSEELPTSLSDDIIELKTKNAYLYESQFRTLEKLKHMIPYENFELRQ